MLSRLMTPREQLLMGAMALAIFAGAAVIARQKSETALPETAIEIDSAVPAAPILQTPPPEIPQPPAPEVGVAAMGAVYHEGLYYLPPDARVKDLLQAAGGATEEADLRDLNLAAHLLDTSTLTVPKAGTAERPPNPAQYTLSKPMPPRVQPSAPIAGRPVPARVPAATLVNINTANSAQLETLPGIGPATAAKIITHRQRTPFRRVEDLENVSGIGPATLRELRHLVRVR